MGACVEMESSDYYIHTMIDLGKEISVFKCRSKICSYLFQCCKCVPFNENSNLLHHLDDFNCNSLIYQLTDVPPRLKPISCKPNFFDITSNFVQVLPKEELQKLKEIYSENGPRTMLKWILRS